MHAEHKQDNYRTERTGIKTSERHCSWRDVYALMGVDPSIDPPATDTTTSRPTTRRAGEGRKDDETSDAASYDDHTVIA